MYSDCVFENPYKELSPLPIIRLHDMNIKG